MHRRFVTKLAEAHGYRSLARAGWKEGRGALKPMPAPGPNDERQVRIDVVFAVEAGADCTGVGDEDGCHR